MKIKTHTTMVNLIIAVLAITIAITIWAITGSNAKKWPVITITLLLTVELILCIYRDNSNFIRQITGLEFVLILLILWILAIAPHVDETNEPPKKPSNTREDKDDKA